MIKKTLATSLISFAVLAVVTYGNAQATDKQEVNKLSKNVILTENSEIQKKVIEYAKFKLTTDLSVLSKKEKQMLPLLFKISDIMDDLFWEEAFGNKQTLFKEIDKLNTPGLKDYVKINYGPWDRLRDNEPFIKSFGKKPDGANFYPKDMTKGEFEAFKSKDKTSQYTILRRDNKGKLVSIPYHIAFKEKIGKASQLLMQASKLAEDKGLKRYLELRAKALLTDNYFESDVAWMKMSTNTIDFVVGPIENYEDGLFGNKTAHSAQILIKDKNWSKKLSKFSKFLPDLQKSLPVDEKYKSETIRSDGELNAYDAIYYSGDSNADGKSIAINLPNDPEVRSNVGSRKLQLKNAMKAKFDSIMVPISKLLISKEQQKHITFDSFFENVMFHEVGHGLGLDYTVSNKKLKVRDALKENYSSIEEGKSDLLGLFLVEKLYEMGEFPKKDLMDNYVTFMAGIFRSIRFGGASAHGSANMIRFNYFNEAGAFTRDEKTGTYKVDFKKMQEATKSLTNKLLVIEGDGDYKSAAELIAKEGEIGEQLKNDLDRISKASIPRDIVFEQGPDVLGLK